jgi:PAS domain S-box-containing protein
MWIFDRQTLCILAVNDAAVGQYGYSRKEFLALTALDIRPSADIQRFLRTVTRCPHAQVKSSLWLHLSKSGQTFWVEIVGEVRHLLGRHIEVVRAIPHPKGPEDSSKFCNDLHRHEH